MSKPSKYGQTTWRHDRLIEAMEARRIDQAGLRRLILRNRAARGDDRITLELKTIRTWMEPGMGPVMGRTGSLPAVFEIADALGVSLDWLTGRKDSNKWGGS
jgi:hypothetical protein